MKTKKTTVGGKSKIELTIPSKLEELTGIESMTSEIADEFGLSEDQKDNLAIAVTEAVGNAIVHGNKSDPQKTVRVQFHLKKDRIEVAVTDQGVGFNPETLDNPIDPDNLLRESGRGIFILRVLMDEVEYSFSKGTTIRFVMKRKG